MNFDEPLVLVIIANILLFIFQFSVLLDNLRIRKNTQKEALEILERANKHLEDCKVNHDRAIALEKEFKENLQGLIETQTKMNDIYNQNLNW